MQHRPLFADVDLFAGKHRLAALSHAAGAGEIEERPHGFVGDPVLRIVEKEPGAFDYEPLAAAGVIGEQGANVRSFTDW